MPRLLQRFALLVVALLPQASWAEQITVAVAANFLRPMEALAREFEAASGHEVRVASGASGKLYAQVRHGAPFHVFFSADQSKPAALLEAGLAVSGSRFTYALGALALWSAQGEGPLDEQTLRSGEFRRLAIANPRLAPYGEAARDALQQLGLWEALQGKLVQGESIAQTYQFVASGNAELGLVALAQVMDGRGSRWPVPRELYSPIRQDAVLLKSAADSAAARDFMNFVRGEQARSTIAAHGYGLADDN